MDNLTKEILVTIPVTEEHKRYLEEQASSGEYHCSFRYLEGSAVKKEDVERAHVIVGNVKAEFLPHAANLELFQLNSAGADQYTKPGILPEGAVLANAKGAYGLAVSEHMLALTFALIRRFPEYHKNQMAHCWKSAGNIISVEGSTVLVLGIGDIGGDYARKMKALGAACVIGIRRTSKEKPDYLDEQYTMEELDSVLGRADIVAMVLPGGSGIQVPGLIRGGELANPTGIAPRAYDNQERRRVRYSELDCNGHLSNTKYLNWMEDLLPAQWHRNHMLSQVHVCYINEATDNQEITLNWTLEDGRDSEAAVQRVFALRALYRQLG